jgi:hypothetical protein
MDCLSPMSVPRPSGKGALDRITIPCGKCMACLSKKRSQWSFRLTQELKASYSAYFVTLTYDNDHIPKNNSLCKSDCQLFLKRLRHRVDTWYITNEINKYELKSKIRYFLVGEYGSNTARPHYHVILFNLPLWALSKHMIEDSWSKDGVMIGQIHIGSVTPASINYTAKYCINEIVSANDKENTFTLMSRRPGIGVNYVERLGDYHRQNKIFYGVADHGKKVSLPRYLRDKIFNDYEIRKNAIEVEKRRDKEIYKGGVDEINHKKQYENKVKNKLKTSSKI